MKKILSFAACAVLFGSLNAATIKVGATPVPHAQILESIKDELKGAGYELEVVDFNDYVMPNLATDSDELDANFFQHKPYLEEFNKNKGTSLVGVTGVHVEPMGIYLKKVKSVNDVKNGGLVCVPNDPTNESRALDLLAKTGVISFEDVELKTAIDIKDNPKNLEIKELEAAQLPRVLNECDLAIINSNYALAAKLNPTKDALFLEGSDSPYVNIVVVKKGNENTDKTKALIKAINTPKVKKFIEDEFKGAIVPAF